MNIVKRVFKLICICIFCIPIVACGRISRFEWNEVEYNKKFTEKYVPVIYSVSSGKVDNNVLGNITKSKMEKFIKHE